MWTENSSSLLSRSPLRFDRMLDQTQRSFWDASSNNRSSPCGTALPIAESGANTGGGRSGTPEVCSLAS